ncbi:MAG: VOC family protein [Thermomicrobiales bacterium]
MEIFGIKHMAIAVENVDDALKRYQQFLGVSDKIEPMDLVKGGSREAHFDFGDVEIQLCQSFEPDHRFARHIAAHGEGLHHMCLSVADIELAVDQALAAGAELKECTSCSITGIHEHSEGWICFLEGESVPGMEIEFMQVYKPDEIPERFRIGEREM